MMHFDNFEGVPRGGGFSFADIERLEAERLLNVIRGVEKQLYDGAVPVPEITLNADSETTKDYEGSDLKVDEFESFRRFASVGYDAHTDGVDDKELRVWKKAFPYIQVEGVGIETGKNAKNVTADNFRDTNNNENDAIDTFLAQNWYSTEPRVDTYYPPEGSVSVAAASLGGAKSRNMIVSGTSDGGGDKGTHGPGNLAIYGTSLTKKKTVGGMQFVTSVSANTSSTNTKAARTNSTMNSSSSNTTTIDEDDIDTVHGVLEDVIAVDVTPNIPIDTTGNTDSIISPSSGPPSPNTSRKVEITSLLLDAVWPEVVDVLTPLVKKIVRYARDNNVRYEPPPDNSSHGRGELGGHDAFADGGYMSDGSGGSGW